MEIFRPKRDIPFMRYGRVTTLISLLTFVAAVFFLFMRGLHLGVDFTGGAVMEVQYAQAVDLERVRQSIKALNINDFTVQHFGGVREIIVRLAPDKRQSRNVVQGTQQSEIILATLKRLDPNATLKRIEYVGPQVGKELVHSGLIALALVCFGIITYLTIRFEWKFALSAVIANLHDVVIILGCFAFFQWEFNLTVLAAVLAVLGYSVNESVVVFDRVRENFYKMRKGTVSQLIDNAITATISRTILTHLSTQLMVTAMLFFGGEALHNFALALTIGILFGIYSAVLVACPLLLLFGLKREDMMKSKPEESEPILR